MINACIVQPQPWYPREPWMPMVPAAPSPGWVGPWVDGPDFELDRLRRLEREAAREREKEAIRERLRRMGVSEDRIAGHLGGLGQGVPRPRCPAAVPTLDDIIRAATAPRSGR